MKKKGSAANGRWLESALSVKGRNPDANGGADRRERGLRRRAVPEARAGCSSATDDFVDCLLLMVSIFELIVY